MTQACAFDLKLIHTLGVVTFVFWLLGHTGQHSSFETQPALPGDTLFVPEELDKTTFVQHAKDWTQILAQFALGVAAFVTLTD